MPRSAGPAHPLHLTERRGGGLRRALGGIHVTVRGSLLPMLVLAGWLTDGTPARAHLWILAGSAALVAHEAAHAAVARAAGLTPHLELSWRGGLTRWFEPDAPSRATEARILLAGPLVGLALAQVALVLHSTLAAASPATTTLAELLAILAGVSVVAAALDLLPVFPRDGSRLLLLALRGQPVDRVVRAACFGAVTAAVATAALVLSQTPELAAATGVLLLTNTWLALWGDRAIGTPPEIAMERRDWTSIRRRIVAGCDSPQLAALAQKRALAVGDHAEAADIGDAALRRGWLSPGFATRTAVARAHLEQDERAMAMAYIAVSLGADPDELAQQPMLGRLRTRLDWPTPLGDRGGDDYVVGRRHTAPVL